MKTIQFAGLLLLAGFTFFTACQKDEDVLPASNQQTAELRNSVPITPALILKGWRDDFSTAASMQSWYLYGSPQPKWVNFANNRFGLFDNNGRFPEGSYAISKARIGNGKGYTIETEVSFDVSDPAGALVCPGIGVTRKPFVSVEPNLVEEGISMKLLYVGKDVPGVDPEYQNHTYVVISLFTDDGRIEATGKYALQADQAGTGWHKIKITVNAQQQAFFYIDNQLVYASKGRIDKRLMANKNVMIGFASPSSAAKSYHDYLRVSYPMPVEEAEIEFPVTVDE